MAFNHPLVYHTESSSIPMENTGEPINNVNIHRLNSGIDAVDEYIDHNRRKCNLIFHHIPDMQTNTSSNNVDGPTKVNKS